MVHAIGKARIQHAETNKVYEIDASDIEFEITGYEDRKMGPEYSHEGHVDHPELGKLLWMLWEYPKGAEEDRETIVDPHKLLSDVDINFDGDVNDPTYELSSQERQSRIDEMVEWFLENFEDPAHQTPFESREGGYQWVRGGPYDAREQLSDNFWEESESLIEEAVAEIQSTGIVEWARVPGSSDFGPDEENLDAVTDSLDDELTQLINDLPSVLTDSAFELGDDGLVHMVTPAGALPPSGNIDLLDELRDAIEALVNSLAGTNGHPELLTAAERYLEVLAAGPVSISLLYARGVRLENAAHSARRSIDADELPTFSSSSEQHLASTLSLHATYIMSTPEGQELVDVAKAFQKPENDLETLTAAVNDLRSAIDAKPDLFGDDVRQFTGEVASDMGQGPHPARSTQVATITLGNLGANLLKLCVVGGGAALVVNGLSASIPGTIATEAITTGFNGVWAFLVANANTFHIMASALGPDLSWATPMANIFEKLRHIRLGDDKQI
jgi:hypothetical protein